MNETALEAAAQAMCDRVNGQGDYAENIGQRRTGWLAQARSGVAAYLAALATPKPPVDEGKAEAKRMAKRGADNVFHELNRDPNWQPTRADYTSLGYLLTNIGSQLGRNLTGDGAGA